MSVLDDPKDIIDSSNRSLAEEYRDAIINSYREADQASNVYRNILKSICNDSSVDIPETYSKLWHDDIKKTKRIKHLEYELSKCIDRSRNLKEKERTLLSLIAWLKDELGNHLSPDQRKGLNCVLSVRGLDEIDMQRVNSYIKQLNYEPTGR